jgi:hypothetical protein
MSDTASALRDALAPKTGMQRIPLVTEHFPHASSPLSLKQLVNLYAEQAPGDARSPVALLSTPGLDTQLILSAGPVHAMNDDLPGLIYVVSGNQFYRLSYDGTPGAPHIVALGDIGTPSGSLPTSAQYPTIAVGVSAVVVCVPPNAFTCLHSDLALVQLGGTFPGSASSVAYLDGYFIFTSLSDLSMFFICRLMDPTNFDALDFAHADASPNVIVRAVSHRGDVWFMGQAAIEIWYNSGDQDFPFRRRPGGVIPVTCGGAPSPATGDASVFWVGVDSTVYRSVGYQSQRISTHGIETQLRALGGAGIAPIGLTYSQNGHIFYAITAGTTTWVYDSATKLWHTRSSSTDGSKAWRIISAANVDDIPLLGDSWTGKLFYANLERDDEDGAGVVHIATLPPLYAKTRRAFCSRLEIEMETGDPPGSITGVPAPGVTLQWSDDGGYTFSGGPRQISSGARGAYRARAFTTRLGSFRERIFRLTTYGHTVYYAVEADVVAGAH